jgi:TolB-like protein/Mg-chelatase subunit ChlD
VNRKWPLPVTGALLISIGLIGFLRASDDPENNKTRNNSTTNSSQSNPPNPPPGPSGATGVNQSIKSQVQSKTPNPTNKPPTQSGKPPSGDGSSKQSGGTGSGSGSGKPSDGMGPSRQSGGGGSGKPPSGDGSGKPKPDSGRPSGGDRSSDGGRRGDGDGRSTRPPYPGFPPGGIIIPPGRPIVPPVRGSDVPPISPTAPAVPTQQPVNQGAAGPGQGGGANIPTPPGYLGRALSRIAVGVRYGIYFKSEGGEASIRLPSHLSNALWGMQDVAPLPVKPGAAPVPVKPGGALPLDGPRSADVLFVVDTTGSMGDEIRDLQNSLDEIVDDFRGPGAELDVQFGMVAFRDQGDEYVTRQFPFTDDLEKFRTTLEGLRAKGGGDIPERGDQALFEGMVKMNWRAERPDRARVIILCGDAAAHDVPVSVKHGGWTYQTTTEWLLTTAQSNHMQIHTVACSGMSPQGLRWFKDLADGSGGTFEDLTNSSRLREELRRRHNLYQQTITPQDLAAVRNSLPRDVRRVAVLPFKNANNEKNMNFLSEVLLDGVLGVLKQQPQLAVSSQSAVLSLMRSRDFRDKSLADGPVAQAMGKRLGADLLVTGFYFSFQDKVHLSGQAIDAGSGQSLVKVEKIVESNSNMFELPLELARELLVKAGITTEPVDSASVQAVPQRSLTATKYFQKAQELGDQAMRYHARESLAEPLKEKALSFVDRAIEHDADFLDAHLLKIGLLESLARTVEVAQALTFALERARSPQIPADDVVRLAIEARYSYVVARDFASAIRVYGQILEKQPTNKHALWQLANLSAGEWGCPPQQRDLRVAKQCVAKIMTLYPTSGMARYLEDAATTLVADPSPATT